MSEDSMLDSRLVVRRGRFTLDVSLSARDGEVIALLGPNGAGKTTALRAVAGLQPLSEGHISVDGRRWDDPAAGGWIAPQHRSIGVVFQDYLLFPHRDARDNIAFGLRRRGQSRATARRAAAEWLDRMDLAEYADRKPRRLSGGQAQRVALARALAVRPRLLLLDEPLAALDARTRLETRGRLQERLREHRGATVLVTHDPVDALVLADRIVIVEEGRIAQEGDAATITGYPRSDYVARLVGLNLYRGHADGTRVRLTDDFALTVAQRREGDSFVAFPPSAVGVRRESDEHHDHDWSATIAGIQRHGDNLRVELRGPVDCAADVTPQSAATLDLALGREVRVSVDADATRVYPAC